MADYIIKKGDTLWHLAKRFGTTVDELAKQNNIKNVNSIFIGQKIRYNPETMDFWPDADGDKKVSEGDFKDCGNFKLFLREVQKYIGHDWTKEIAKEIKGLYNKFVNNPNQASVQGITVNSENTDLNLKPNYFANSFDRELSALSLNDGNPATEIRISISMGKDLPVRDRKVSDFLKKVLGDNLDNTSVISDSENGYQIKTVRMEGTDLYKAFKDVNSGIFTQEQNGKYKDDVFVENFSGEVQLPSTEVTANNVKYFTLHTSEGKVLYFNEKGESVSSLDELEQLEHNSPNPQISENYVNPYIDRRSGVFNPRGDAKEDKLNIGDIYINGQRADDINLNTNYYANGLDRILGEMTLNSDGISKLEVQLRAGANMKSDRDVSPKDILKKYLGDNLENTTSVENGNLAGTKFEDTDLYREFIRLNPDVKGLQKGDNIQIQLPTMKMADNCERYFVLLDESNQPLYFDSTGKRVFIQSDEE